MFMCVSVCVCVCVCVLIAQSCPALCNSMDCGLSGSSIHGILQARVLEWVAIPVFRGSSQPKDWTQFSCFAGRFFTVWVTGEAQFSCVETWTTSDALWIRLASQRISHVTCRDPFAHSAAIIEDTLCVSGIPGLENKAGVPEGKCSLNK